MSMNINIDAVGEIIYPSGLKQPYIESFNCIQTPTTITNQILDSDDFIQAYKEWILSRYKDEQEPIYDSDIWDETAGYYKIIGYETVNRGKTAH